mmetsp:Transcript_77234/g.215843  ORF Transcript_77234/g.215843 Transcript_77234/m.215843 type:complete len:382 (-) Transcript_77234:16-1161(-)
MLKSSIPVRPKLNSGLSFDALGPPALGFHRPELVAHCMIFRSLSSTYSGFSARNPSSQSKVPSSGNPTGSTTSCLPSFRGAAAMGETSSFAAPWSMRHLNGSAFAGCGPHIIWMVTFLNDTCGNNAWPCRCSGSGWGSATRTPSTKRLTVLAVGLLMSTLSSTPTTWSRVKRCEHPVFFSPLAWKHPSESKQTQSLPSPSTSEDPAVEKPSRASCRGIGTRPFAPEEDSDGLSASTIFTSYMYRPATIPTFARAPAMRYCIPPSDKAMTMLPPMAGMALSVQSEGLKPIGPVYAGRLSAGASFSLSPLSSFLEASGLGFAKGASFFASFFGAGSSGASALRFFSSAAFFAASSSTFVFFFGGMAAAANRMAKKTALLPLEP